MIVVHASFSIAESGVDEFLAVFAEAGEAARAEAGNVSYRLCRSADTPTEFIVVEQWKSEDALREHMQTEAMAVVNAKLPALLAGAPSIEIFANPTPMTMGELMAAAR